MNETKTIKAIDLVNLIAAAIGGELTRRTRLVWTIHPTFEKGGTTVQYLAQTSERVRIFQVQIAPSELPVTIVDLIDQVKKYVDYVLGYWEVR